MKIKRKMKVPSLWKSLLGILILIVVILHAVKFFFPETERQARQKAHDAILSSVPEAVKQVYEGYGLTPYPSGDQKIIKGLPAVVLIHGLDEPGRVWLNLAPALSEKGFAVWLMTYPNDQAIDRSARFFYDSLEANDFSPVDSLIIVGHSMGGLVTRQMLTAPEIRYGEGGIQGRCPRISRVIMVGTPNHGSELARFRFVMEIRDQVQNLFQKETHWLASLLDGTGAAGIDLLPGSAFLTRLNARPHPEDIEMTVIAGILSPWTLEIVAEATRSMASALPGRKSEVQVLGEALNSVAAAVGDGLVSLESARLEGVPLIQVAGTHLTMIRNLSKTSNRVPPAVPVILKLLSEKRRDSDN